VVLTVLALTGVPAAVQAGGPAQQAHGGTQAAAPGAGYKSALKQALRYRRQIQKARKELRRVDHGPLRRAIGSFGNTSMPASERRKLLAEASGEPLTDSALAFARGLAGFVPRGAFERAGRASRRELGTARSAVKSRWWGNFVPEDLSETGRALDALAEAVEKPEFRGQLDTALNVLRVAGRIEADNLSQLSGRVPPEKMPAVRDAFSRYAADVAAEVVDATGGGTMSRESKAATGRLVSGLIDVAQLVKETAGQPDHVRDLTIAPAVLKLKKDIELTSGDARSAFERVAANGSLEAVNWKRLTRRMAVHHRRLTRTLSTSVEMDPEARAAASALARDAELTGRFALGVARIIGAGSNTQMVPAERAKVVKEAAESMGPIFIKMVQTIINQSGGLEAFGLGNSPDDSVVLLALTELQDNVTPMTEREVRSQIKKSLGKDVELAFAEFDMTPFRSASIAQVHRAKVWVRSGPFFKKKLVEVAVKIQRPGLKTELKDAVRASRLAMAVARESLRAFDISSKTDIDPVKIGRALDLADNSLADFIRSFEIETDFKAEKRQMKRFARLVRSEPDVYVPRVFDKQSGSEVLTMEFVRGDKLSDPTKPDSNSDFSKRLDRALAARQQPAALGALPAEGAEAEARSRAADHAVRTWGLDPTSIQVTRDQKGDFEAVARFDSEAQPVARFKIRARDGRIFDRSTVPELSKEGMTALRDRMLGSFINHILVNRYVHGDIHRGNFKILADGRTLALLDFGQVVELKPRHFTAPAQLAVGLWRKNTGVMASAIVSMSDQFASMSRSERRKAAADVKSVLDESMAAGDPGSRFSPEALSGALVGASAKAGLTLSSVYLQWMKTSFAMWGNVSEATTRADPIGLRTGKRTVGRMVRSLAIKSSPLSTAMAILKRRRVERLLRESAPETAD
jgi:predicted unusual protein kinase regulating ubiquinone biosynthesis (AarF/ABC1/UbiB family)